MIHPDEPERIGGDGGGAIVIAVLCGVVLAVIVTLVGYCPGM